MKIDHFFIKQLKKNLKVLVIFFTNLVLIVFLIIFFIKNTSLVEKQKQTLTSEIDKLEQKKNLLKSFESSKILNLNDLNKTLFLLIPSSQDYFSIISTLERLSSKTNFLITNYELNLANSSPQRLAVNISGVGNRNDFLNFIKNYKFSGYRLITIDKIFFSESKINPDEKITLNFYIDKKEKGETPAYVLKKSDYELINKIQSAIDLNQASENIDQSPEELQYETKTNPF